MVENALNVISCFEPNFNKDRLFFTAYRTSSVYVIRQISFTKDRQTPNEYFWCNKNKYMDGKTFFEYILWTVNKI